MTIFPRLALGALPLLALAACIETAPMPADDNQDLCGASALSGLVGQPAEVLQTLQLPAGTRIIKPGDPVTRDLRRDRLNVEIGADGRIANVACY
ncbi:MAG TPA: hypothetical protein GX686_08530 [Paracoccus sp.]|nr:hypothetical protein [Paracoccus sp. (in: a-proteobacteria)]